MKKLSGSQLLMAAACAAAVLLCGCHADIYYQNRAIERARAFMLKEAGDLDWKQQEFVRYSDPVILHSHIIGKKGIGSAEQLNSEQRQICVAWQIPGKDELYMVYAASNGRMDYWFPERLIRKRYQVKPAPLARVSALASNYAVNNLYQDLKPEEINAIRFTCPALLITDFKLDEAAGGKSGGSSKLQFSLVWQLPGARSAYFCGCGTPDLSEWSVERAGLADTAEINARTVRVVLTPEQSRENLPDLAKRDRIGCKCSDFRECVSEGVCKNPVKSQEK